MQADKSTEHTEAWDKIHSAHGILVPGGFGIRGVEGMILAAKYAREKEVPYLGICLGMQVGRTFDAACMPTGAGIVIHAMLPWLSGCCTLESLPSVQAYASKSLFLMQVAVIEFARNVLGLQGAHSAEFDAATPTPAVVFMPEGSKTHKGGTMRLGARKTILQTMDCITARLYQVGIRLAPAASSCALICPTLRHQGLKTLCDTGVLKSLD